MTQNYKAKRRLLSVFLTVVIVNMVAFCFYLLSQVNAIKQVPPTIVVQPAVEQATVVSTSKPLAISTASADFGSAIRTRDSFRLAWEEPVKTWSIKRSVKKVEKVPVKEVKTPPKKVEKKITRRTEKADKLHYTVEGKMEDVLGHMYTLKTNKPRSKYPRMYDYVKKYWNDAVNDQIKYGIPASITLAQGMLESDSEKSILAREAKNHFGIKYFGKNKIPKEVMPYFAGYIYRHDDCCTRETRNNCKDPDRFVKYTIVKGSYIHHSIFVQKNRYKRYISRQHYKFNDWAWAFKWNKGGYATSKSYHQDLINLIKRLKLHELDAVVFTKYGNPLF